MKKTTLNVFKKCNDSPLTKAKHSRSYYTSTRLKGGRLYSSEASIAVASSREDGADVGPPPLNARAQQKLADRVSNVQLSLDMYLRLIAHAAATIDRTFSNAFAPGCVHEVAAVVENIHCSIDADSALHPKWILSFEWT